MLALDLTPMRATLYKSYMPIRRSRARPRSIQILPNGNVLVGWGRAPISRSTRTTANSSTTRIGRTAARSTAR